MGIKTRKIDLGEIKKNYQEAKSLNQESHCYSLISSSSSTLLFVEG